MTWGWLKTRNFPTASLTGDVDRHRLREARIWPKKCFFKSAGCPSDGPDRTTSPKFDIFDFVAAAFH